MNTCPIILSFRQKLWGVPGFVRAQPTQSRFCILDGQCLLGKSRPLCKLGLTPMYQSVDMFPSRETRSLQEHLVLLPHPHSSGSCPPVSASATPSTAGLSQPGAHNQETRDLIDYIPSPRELGVLSTHLFLTRLSGSLLTVGTLGLAEVLKCSRWTESTGRVFLQSLKGSQLPANRIRAEKGDKKRHSHLGHRSSGSATPCTVQNQ